MNHSPKVQDYMSDTILTVTPDDDIHHAIQIMLRNRVSGLPVVGKNGEVVGILTEKDCFKVAFSASYHREPGGLVAEFMNREVESVRADSDITEMAEKFLRGRYRRYPVLANGRLVGLISRPDVLRALDDLW